MQHAAQPAEHGHRLLQAEPQQLMGARTVHADRESAGLHCLRFGVNRRHFGTGTFVQAHGSPTADGQAAHRTKISPGCASGQGKPATHPLDHSE